MKTDQIYKLFKESSGIATDSRNIGKGQIFFALWGGNFNGNKFAAQALEKGASWAVIDDPLYETDRTVLVDDTLLELQALATHHSIEMNVPVLAITGTNGKTTTKELTAAVLSRKYKVHYTKGNLNNHIGVPLTILSAPENTEMMIVEMGANHPGEIRTLCQIAKPGYGLITNIGTAHIEGFGSFEGVVRAKTEMYEYLKKVNGIALFNDKDPLLTEMIYKYVNRAVPYSDPAGFPLTLKPEHEGINLSLDVSYNYTSFSLNTNLFGGYNLWNVKAAMATGLFFEVDMKEIVSAIGEYHPSNNRSQVKITKNNTLICDSYNANPSSMHSALVSFASIKDKPLLVILGDMLELGGDSELEHRRIADEIDQLGIKNVYLTGKIFEKAAVKKAFRLFPDVEALADQLKKEPVSGYMILIKGSRGIGLERIYDLL